MVYNHLQEVSPTLAAEFSTTRKFQLSFVKLEKILEVYSQSDNCDAGEQIVDGKIVGEGKVNEVGTPHTKKIEMRSGPGKDESMEVNKYPETRANLTLSPELRMSSEFRRLLRIRSKW